MDVHKDAIAGASGAHAHGAEGISLRPSGTRQADLEHLPRTLHSKAQPLVWVSDAGPCGDWCARALSQQGDDGWGVAPSRLPTTAGERVTTDRREAMPWARLRRSGALPPVSVPTVAEEALRDLGRAREEAIRALTAATCRLHALGRRHARRAVPRGRHHGGRTRRPAPRRPPQTPPGLLGPAPCGLFPSAAAPSGDDDQRGEPPGPSGAGRGRLGRACPRDRQEASPPAARHPPTAARSSADRPTGGWASALARCSPAGTTRPQSWSRWPGHASAAWGPWPQR